MTSDFTVDDLVSGLRDQSFRRVVFLVGAGISVAAGIPDFRTPKTGLYAQVKKLGLPVPEDIFSLEFFLHNPRPFYSIAKEFLFYNDLKPVLAHRFMKAAQSSKQLLMVYTQNIDGLELQAGILEKNIVQAHGHMRSAHCVTCKSEYSMKEFELHCQQDRLFFCPKCNPDPNPAFVDTTNSEVSADTKTYHCDSGGVVKPDIIFFGEKVSRPFHRRLQKIADADLVIVMGTSLKVSPFSQLLGLVPESTPLVIVNKELPKIARQNVLFLPGDIEASLQTLAEQIGWSLSDSQQEHTEKRPGKRGRSPRPGEDEDGRRAGRGRGRGRSRQT